MNRGQWGCVGQGQNRDFQPHSARVWLGPDFARAGRLPYQDYKHLSADIMRPCPSQVNQHGQVKRHHLYAVLGFFAGMLLSYLIWGRAEITTIPVSQLSSTASGTPTPETSGQASDLAAQLENLPRHDVPVDSNDPGLGPGDAALTIIEFADFECPYCQRHALETHPRLIEEYGAQVRFVYKDFPLTSIHAEA